MRIVIAYLIFLVAFTGYQRSKMRTSDEKQKETVSPNNVGEYGYDLAFLKKELQVVELVKGETRLVVVPKYQGRVMISSSMGLKGRSYGWINYNLITSQKTDVFSNPYGGEERVWLGPEGGQFSVFYAGGNNNSQGKWKVPAPLDHEDFSVKNQNPGSVTLDRDFEVVNKSGNKFQIRLTRTITLSDTSEVNKNLGFKPGKSVHVVAYKSESCLKNIGNKVWNKETGTLSIWALSMLEASPFVTVILPYRNTGEGKIFTDYFGNLPENRLKVKEHAVLFRVDGNYRSKIGISSIRAVPYIGSYNSRQKTLSVIGFSLSNDQLYVNSSLENQQTNPFSGDAVNAYNDGPHADGSLIGKLYELETSSPAAFLQPGEEMSHVRRTYHFEGSEEDLDQISKSLLHVSLDEIKNAFGD
jgi:hypothetical protein